MQGKVVVAAAVAVERLEKIDQLEIKVGIAAGGKLKASLLEFARKAGKLVIAAAELAEHLRLVQETVVVADEIEHHEVGLAGRQAQAAAKLLQKENFRFGRAQHEDGVDGRQVDALIEEIDREDDL